MIPVVLWLLDRFRKLYVLLGVDFNQLRAIVGTKLLMDNRRNTSAFQQQKKETSTRFVLVVLLYTLFGGFVAFAIATLPSFLVSMTLYHAFLMVIIIMTLISDFSSVLLDTSDNTIVLPRPVSGKTLVAARITHILLYLGQITLAMMIAPVIVTAVKFGALMSLALAGTTLLSVIFAVMFTNGFYLLLMQLTTEERLKTVINYFQIITTIVIMGGYQLLPRLLGPNLMEIEELHLSWWSGLIPPLWMAGTLDTFHSHEFDLLHSLSILLALVAPLGGFYLVNKYLTPKFGSRLADLGTGSPTAEKEKVFSPNEKGGWLTKKGLERAVFAMVSKMLSRDRKLKLKIYPSIASIFIVVFVILLNQKGSLHSMINSLPRSSSHILLLYASFFVVQTILAEMAYTDEFRAAWIYTSAPIARPGEILSGTLKAVIVKFYIPVFLVICAVILLIWKQNAIDDIFFAIGSNAFLFLAVANISNKRLPFSMEPSLRNQSGTFVRTMISFVLMAIVGGLHFFLAKVAYVLWIGGPLLFIGSWFLLEAYRGTTWKDLDH